MQQIAKPAAERGRRGGKDIHGAEAVAVEEGMVSDAGHTGWNRYRLQNITEKESTLADAGHTGWDGDRGKADTIPEGIVSDAGHRSGDGDR